METGLPVSPPASQWRVLVRERDGTESEGIYEQAAGEPPPIPQVVIVVGSRRVVVEDVSTVDPPPGRAGSSARASGTPAG